MTHLEYYAYRLADRDDFSILHSSQKLFLQFILDAFLTEEGNRLEWYKENQQVIRADNYKNLNNFIEHKSEQTT